MKHVTLQRSLFLSTLLHSSLAYKWPNPQIDEVDHNLYDQFGFNANNIFAGGVPTCSNFFFGNNSGRQNAAEWLRTAFHDMSTHDAAAGTGGLDASIAVEADRPENVGSAINSTVAFFLAFVSPRLSLADLLAMGVRTAMDACGGPEVPYSVGRIDDFTPGPSGVPEPQQDLQTHIDAFSRMGFTQEEMIGLVACGHSIGGVHNVNFPEIVPPPADPSTNQAGVQHFDSTFDVYDNVVAAEFVSGVPNNALAFGANQTTNSDFRIFSSDGNATISSFAASQDTYISTCSGLLERMINTVPSNVNLSDAINPIPVKPSIFFDIQEDGSLNLTGQVRFFDMQTNPNRVVQIAWLDRNGQCSQGTCSATASNETQVTTTTRNKQSLWYSFNATIDSTASISKFWFEVDEGDGSGPQQVNSEAGSPFPVEDRLFILPSQTCITQLGSGLNITTTFAIREGSQPVNPELDMTAITNTFANTYTRSDSTVPATLSSNSTSPNYQIYQASFNVATLFATTTFFDISAQIGGEDVTDPGWALTDLFDAPFGGFSCPA